MNLTGVIYDLRKRAETASYNGEKEWAEELRHAAAILEDPIAYLEDVPVDYDDAPEGGGSVRG